MRRIRSRSYLTTRLRKGRRATNLTIDITIKRIITLGLCVKEFNKLFWVTVHLVSKYVLDIGLSLK